MPSASTHPVIRQPNERVLLHLGYRFPEDTLFCRNKFSAIRSVIVCGSTDRARSLANQFSSSSSSVPLTNLCRTDRFVLYSPTPQVLISSHGIGLGSIDCLLQEVYFILKKICEKSDWFMLRVGSSGGIAIPPGTIVVTRQPLNGLLENKLSIPIVGKMHHFLSLIHI